VLDDLLDLPPKWNNLVNYLEGEISKLAIVNIRPLVPALPLRENASPCLWQRFAITLYVPYFIKRHWLFLGINSF
jgi:hypothetical protein